MLKSCAFCGRKPPEIKLSKEHVIRSFLRHYFHGPPKNTKFTQKYENPLNGQLLSKKINIPTGPFNMTVNKICKTCNETWLNNNIEIPAEKLLIDLMNNIEIQITSEHLYTLAIWASKTAAVRSLMDPDPKVIPTEHFHHIMTELTPPPGTYVYLCNINSPEYAITRHSRFFISSDNEFNKITLHITTIILGHVGFIVVGVSDENYINFIKDNILNKIESNYIKQIWPIKHPLISNIYPISLQSVLLISESFVTPKYSTLPLPELPAIVALYRNKG